MKAKASICISEEETLIESLKIAIGRIKSMIDKGMDNSKKVLQSLINKANNRIKESNQVKSHLLNQIKMQNIMLNSLLI